MSDNGRFYEAIESGSDSPHQKYSEEGGELFNSIACPIRFRFDREFFSEGNDGGGDGEGGCCGLSDEVAGDGAEGHCEEHRDQAHRRADYAKERLRLEFFLDGIQKFCGRIAEGVVEGRVILAEFEESKKEELKETPGEHAVSLKDAEKEAEKINASIDNAKQNILAYESRLDGLRESLDEWEELGDTLKELKLEQEEEKKLYKYTSTAKDALVKAKETMTSRYVKPLLESLKTYYKTITGLNPEVLHMDANTNITIDEAGLQRDAELFSTGYRDLFGIALRVAFADAMYTEEIPFLIMDDPFVNLDDSKLKNVREFLKILSEKYQILYFTCSNSR